MISSNKLALTLVLAAVLAVGISGIATQTYAQSKTINADKVTIKKGSDITINVNGGAGAKGEKGDKGDTGSPGNPGAPGANGANGTGIPAEDLATVNTILQLYANGSLSSVEITAENITVPTNPVNESGTGGGNTTQPVVCQPGTHEEDGVCVVDDVVLPPTNETGGNVTIPTNDTGPLPPINETSPENDTNSTG